MPSVSSLHIYPVKSCKAVNVESFGLDRFGPIGDRRWMIVSDDPNQPFITQRAQPILAKLEARYLDKGTIELKTPDLDPIQVTRSENAGPTRSVTIWKDRVHARDTGDVASKWLSTFLNQSVRLVRIHSEYARFINAEKSSETGFADGYPLLIISQASLDDLNDRLDYPVEMRRFRPNLVVQNCDPYEEDKWTQIRIGDTILSASGPCSRCIMTTVNPDTGALEGNEPLVTLAGYRKTGNGVTFGQNYINETKFGQIDVGMEIEIL